MYRILISEVKEPLEKYGIFHGKEFFVSSPQEVCDILELLSSVKLIYTLSKFELSTIDDVKQQFFLK